MPRHHPTDEDTGSNETIDFSIFSEGDIEPSLNKKINTLISATNDFIVYLDDDLFVEWSYNGNSPEGEGEVMNRVGYLETLSEFKLEGRHMEHFRRLLGESIARLLEEGNARTANKILNDAERFLEARSSEKARMWYLTSASVVTVTGLIVVFILWLANKNQYSFLYLTGDGFDVAEGALLGGAGALISVISRTQSISMDVATGRLVYYIEGAARILLGMLGAFLIALSVKANLILGVVNNTKDYEFPFLLLLCMVAGASERLVPNLIRQVESSVSIETSRRSDEEEKGNKEKHRGRKNDV